MAKVRFTANLHSLIECPEGFFPGASVAEVLDEVFRDRGRLRGYVLDEQGRLRKHVVVYVDGRPVQDRLTLEDPVSPDGEVFVMQALSGG
jgi:hypothetical protein